MWDTEKLSICKLRIHNGASQVYISIEIASNLSWEAKLCGKPLCRSRLLCNTPQFLTSPMEVAKVLSILECDMEVCTGNEDAQFIAIADSRGGKFYNHLSECWLHVAI